MAQKSPGGLLSNLLPPTLWRRQSSEGCLRAGAGMQPVPGGGAGLGVLPRPRFRTLLPAAREGGVGGGGTRSQNKIRSLQSCPPEFLSHLASGIESMSPSHRWGQKSLWLMASHFCRRAPFLDTNHLPSRMLTYVPRQAPGRLTWEAAPTASPIGFSVTWRPAPRTLDQHTILLRTDFNFKRLRGNFLEYFICLRPWHRLGSSPGHSGAP